jgi:hypothetical protein
MTGYTAKSFNLTSVSSGLDIDWVRLGLSQQALPPLLRCPAALLSFQLFPEILTKVIFYV